MTTRKLLGSACLLLSGMFGLTQAYAQAAPGGDYLRLFNGRSGTYSVFTDSAAAPEFMAFNAGTIGLLAGGTINAATFVGAAPTTQYYALLENPAFGPDIDPVTGAPAQCQVQLQQGCLSDIIMYIDGGFAAPPNVAMFSDLHPLFADPTLGSIIALLDPTRMAVETGFEIDVSSFFRGATAPAGLAAGTLYAFSDVPVPAAAWLFGSALGLLGLRRRVS